MYQFADNNDNKETVFTIKVQDLKFGVGALRELGPDAVALKMERIALFLDGNIQDGEPIHRVKNP
jgi:hypothetical protein